MENVPKDMFWLGFPAPTGGSPRKQGQCTQRCRVKPTSSRRGLVCGGAQRGLQSKVASSASTQPLTSSPSQPPPLSHRKQAPPLLSGNSSLASSGSKCLRERTRAGRGTHREDRRAEMHRRGAAHRHACGRLRAAPGRDAREGPEAGQLATLAFLLGGRTATPSSRSHRPGVNKRWKEGQPLRP